MRWLARTLVLVPVWGFLPAACSSPGGETSGAGEAASGNGESSSDSAGCPAIGPEEICFDPEVDFITARFSRERLVLAPGQTRAVKLYVNPEVCEPTRVDVVVSDESVARSAQAEFALCYSRSSQELLVTAGALGVTTLRATVPRPGASPIEAEIPIEVVSEERPRCNGSASAWVDSGKLGRLFGASVGFQEGATAENSGSYLWSVDPFEASIRCKAEEDQVPEGFSALGPAFEFGPVDKTFPRDIPFTLPINPALMPEHARLRHVTVSYTGPAARSPRVIPIADPKIVKTGDGYALSFMAPRLGTYQAVVQLEGGKSVHQRRLTYRAMIGVSMGGAGTSLTGFQNHHRFDVLAPLGGPVEWTWLLGHLARNHMAGFLPNDGQVAPEGLAAMPEARFPYAHPSTFNQWWYEYPKEGNGGSFNRADYVQIFRDLALMFGNPAGYNPLKGAENLPPGVSPTDAVVVGDREDRSCAVWVEPIDDHPDKAVQERLHRECPRERCKPENQLRLEGFYDRKFNPLGTWPVISFCDGSPQDAALSPYANTWTPAGNDKPLELSLAVDYNDNGQRDINEPVIYQGFEPFDDFGPDGVPSPLEVGYQQGVNDDPAGDDWDPQFNPLGTEGNYRYDAGEPFLDHGLDGVAGTRESSPYDYGEANGGFDYAPGYRTFIERDARSVIGRHPLAGGQPFDDAAMSRVDLWTDGGLRDLFNSHIAAYALVGEWAARARVVHYYTQFGRLPGQIEGKSLDVSRLNWADIPGGVLLRYGAIDPTPSDIESGSGQHVGTALQVAQRLQVALYYIGSRWQNAPRTLHRVSGEDPHESMSACERQGVCRFEFTDSRGRRGPVSVTLPPGYAHRANVTQDTRYPVIFMLHGYGQTPDDLAAAAPFLTNWMNFHQDSSGLRLPKSLIVYLDGRCRPNGPGEESECIRGNFYTDSVREKGPQMTQWVLELMDELDSRFRTMAPEVVDWVE